jgi:hypothetical protein
MQLEASVANALIGMRKALDTELDRSVAALRHEMGHSDDELRDNLPYVLAGNVRGRVIGAILVGGGIVLGAVGSMIGTLS